MDRFQKILALSILLSFASLTSAASQGESLSGTAEGDPCVAEPEELGGGNEAKVSKDTLSLTEQLDRCGGVIEPPAVGDRELVEPAPEKGATPIIPPSALPEQQPAEGDAG